MEKYVEIVTRENVWKALLALPDAHAMGVRTALVVAMLVEQQRVQPGRVSRHHVSEELRSLARSGWIRRLGSKTSCTWKILKEIEDQPMWARMTEMVKEKEQESAS